MLDLGLAAAQPGGQLGRGDVRGQGGLLLFLVGTAEKAFGKGAKRTDKAENTACLLLLVRQSQWMAPRVHHSLISGSGSGVQTRAGSSAPGDPARRLLWPRPWRQSTGFLQEGAGKSPQAIRPMQTFC